MHTIRISRTILPALPAEPSILKIHKINKSFHTRKVVNNMSFSVQSGKIMGLLGPNGAGKTTSFYMVAGLIPCDSGKILFDDQEISGLSMDRRARLGMAYLPQESSIFRALSVEENIMAILETRPGFNRDIAPTHMNALLRAFQLEHLRTVRGINLSGGERRRVEIARALATRPRFLLLDEPFAGVDPISVQGLQKMIHDLAEQGLGILITDHNVRETLGICNSCCIVHEGRIQAQGTAQAILHNKKVRKVYLGEQFSM